MIGVGRRFGNVLRSHFDDVDVICPNCGSKAIFTCPYDYLKDEAAEKAAGDPRVRGVLWSGGFVVERFPIQFPWRDKNNPYTWRGHGVWGVVSCGHCPYRKKHLLEWPVEAFYRVELTFGALWAYTREHLVQIRNYIAGVKRKTSWQRLNQIPKDFLLVRNRQAVLKGIDQQLAKPDTPPVTGRTQRGCLPKRGAERGR